MGFTGLCLKLWATLVPGLVKINIAEIVRVPSLSWKRPFFFFLSFSSFYSPTRRPEPAFMKMNNQMESLHQQCQGTCCCHSSEPLARAAQSVAGSWNFQLITNVLLKPLRGWLRQRVVTKVPWQSEDSEKIFRVMNLYQRCSSHPNTESSNNPWCCAVFLEF